MPKKVQLSGDRTLIVEDQGQGEAALLCLHGLGGGGYFFHDLGEALFDKCRTLSFDMPGWRQNREASKSFSFDECANVVIELIERECSGPAYLLGHSMGTIVALKANAKRPDLVRGMIFLGGLAKPIDAICEKISQRIEKIATEGMASVSDDAMRGIFSKQSLEERPEVVEGFKQKFEANEVAAYSACANELISSSAIENIDSVEAPCVAITGQEDLYASPENVEAFASRLPVATETKVFENCGHMIFYEDPERLALEVSNFLKT